MTDSKAKTNMTYTGLEERRPNNEEELPVVLLHGTSGQSEDWSQVVEQLRRCGIRLPQGIANKVKAMAATSLGCRHNSICEIGYSRCVCRVSSSDGFSIV